MDRPLIPQYLMDDIDNLAPPPPPEMQALEEEAEGRIFPSSGQHPGADPFAHLQLRIGHFLDPGPGRRAGV
jgi:hypothetical protein